MVKASTTKERAAVADRIFEMHNGVNRAVSVAVQSIMEGAPAEPAIHLMETAIDLSVRKMRESVADVQAADRRPR